MVQRDKNTRMKIKLNANNGNDKLLALIVKKGKRDITRFKKSFGKDPDFPSIDFIRETAWP